MKWPLPSGRMTSSTISLPRHTHRWSRDQPNLGTMNGYKRLTKKFTVVREKSPRMDFFFSLMWTTFSQCWHDPTFQITKRESNISIYSISVPHLFAKLKALIKCWAITHFSRKKTTNSDFSAVFFSWISSVLTSSGSGSLNLSSFSEFSWPSASEFKSQLAAVAGFMFLKYGVSRHYLRWQIPCTDKLSDTPQMRNFATIFH